MWPPAGTGPSRGPWNPHLPPQADLDASSSAPDCPSPSPRTLGARLVPEAQGCPWQQVQPPTASSQQCSLIFYMQTPQQGQGLHPTPSSADSAPTAPPLLGAAAWLPDPPSHETEGSVCPGLTSRMWIAVAGRLAFWGPPRSPLRAHACSHPQGHVHTRTSTLCGCEPTKLP